MIDWTLYKTYREWSEQLSQVRSVDEVAKLTKEVMPIPFVEAKSLRHSLEESNYKMPTQWSLVTVLPVGRDGTKKVDHMRTMAYELHSICSRAVSFEQHIDATGRCAPQLLSVLEYLPEKLIHSFRSLIHAIIHHAQLSSLGSDPSSPLDDWVAWEYLHYALFEENEEGKYDACVAATVAIIVERQAKE